MQHNTSHMRTAERHLAAFARAVHELYGAEQARLAVEDWVEELELAGWPEGETAPDWRQITVAAAARLADRIDIDLSQTA